MKSALLFRLWFVMAAAGFGAAIVRAEDPSVLKARMDQRQEKVDALRERRVAGENNRGYLEARGAVSPAEQAIISDENADRRAVYAALAAKNNTSVDQLGRTRAQQIAMRANRGVWIQDSSGGWRQK